MFAKAFGALKPWIITIALVLATGFIKLLVNELLNFESPTLLFFAAIAISAWAGGLRQGLAAIVFSILFILYNFILAPASHLPTEVWVTRLLLFAIDGLAISVVCSALRTSRNKLKYSEGRMRRIFESNMIGLCVTKSDGTIIEANDYFVNMLKITQAEVNSGKLNWRNFTAPDSLEKSAEVERLLRETGTAAPFEKEYIRTDGTRVSALVGAARVEVGTTIGFVLDLSRSKMAERLSQSEQFLQSVVEFIPNMIFVKDAKDLRFVRFNRAGEELVGHPRDALIGKSDYDFFPKEQADFFVAKDRSVLENGVVVDIPEEPITTPNGVRYLHTKKIPLFDTKGKPEYLIGISEDITERKIAEQQKIELIQAQAAREEAEKSAERLAILSEQASEANRAKSAFLANISHELRTPLGAMLGFAELALESGDAEKNAGYVRTVLRNGKELLRIVDEILDLSKAESNSMDIEKVRFSLPVLIGEIQHLMNVRAQQKNLTLRFQTSGELPEFVISDPFRLKQVLLNVIGNAIKFTESGSVTVETTFAENVLRFSVSDTGIGIPDDQARRLFQPFTQADDSTTRKFGGTGLGLFLSRRLAKLMGGDVRLLDSAFEKGSRFEVSVRVLPAATQEKNPIEEKRAVERRPAPAAKGAKVLIVDDSEDNQDLLAAYLAGNKLEIETAGRGSQAIEMADDSHSAILMDIQMPEMDGFEALRRIREKGVKSPVIAITAHAMKGDRERCLENGFDDYLSKPISKKVLEECLRQYL